MSLLLWQGSRKMGDEARFDRRFWSRFWRIVVASWLMGCVLYGANLIIGAMFYDSQMRYLALAILVALGIGSYALIGQIIGAFRLSEFRAALRRQ